MRESKPRVVLGLSAKQLSSNVVSFEQLCKRVNPRCNLYSLTEYGLTNKFMHIFGEKSTHVPLYQ
jgi:hypothetical protein